MYKNAEKVYRSNYEAGYMDEERMRLMIENINKLYPSLSAEDRKNIASFDAGLVSMQIMLIAKARGYDTVPMGGFNKKQFVERFNISDRFVPTVLIALGKAAAPAYKTTRIPVEDIVRFL